MSGGRLLSWPVRHPAAALGVTGVLSVLAVVGVTRLRISPSLADMFAADDPAAAALVRVLDDFAAVDNLLVLASTPAERPPEPEKLLGFAERLAAEVRRSPAAGGLAGEVMYRAPAQGREFVEKVLGPNGLFYLDDAAFASARKRLTREGMREQLERDESLMSAPGPAGAALSAAIQKDPLRLHEFLIERLMGERPFKTWENGDAFISEDGRSILVRVTGKRPPSDLEFSKRFTAEMTTIAERANTDGLRLEVSGAYAIAAASERAVRHDMIASVIGSVVCLHLLFLVGYRSPFKLFALAFGPVALGVLWGFGVYSVVSGSLTPMTAVLGGILAGMGIDYSIQCLSQYEHLRGTGKTVLEAAEGTVSGVAGALLAAWATSVVGFLAIGWSSLRALRDFALLGTLGLGGAFVLALVLLPALLTLIDREDARARTRLRFTPERLLRWAAGHARALGGAVIAVFIAAVGVVVLVPGELFPLESDLNVMHPRPNPALEAQMAIGRRFGGSPEPLLVYFRADSPDGLVSVAHRVDQRLRTAEAKDAGVVATLGMATWLPDPQVAAKRAAEMKGVDVNQVIADFKAAIAESIFEPSKYEGYAQGLRSVLTREKPPGVADLVNYPQLAESMLPKSALSGAPATEAVTLVFVRQSPRDRVERDKVLGALRRALAGVPGATLTGLGVVGESAERIVRHDLPRLVVIAVILVAVYLVGYFRSPAAAVMALLPTVFSLTVLLAFMRLAGVRLNMINLIALPLLIGIDVDYGIFLVSLTRRNAGRPEQIPHAAATAHAIVMCAAATTLGYGSLVTTSVPAIRSLGIVVAVGIVACVVAVMMGVVPVLLRRRGTTGLNEPPSSE